MSSTDGSVPDGLDGILAEMDGLLRKGAPIAVSSDDVQRIFAAAVKLYLAKRLEDPDLLPFDSAAITATDVATTASGMLKAVNLEVFELGIWNAWSSS